MSVASKAVLSAAFSLLFSSAALPNNRCGCPSSSSTTINYDDGGQTVINQSNGNTTITTSGHYSAPGISYGVWRNSEMDAARADLIRVSDEFDRASDAYFKKGKQAKTGEFQRIVQEYTAGLHSYNTRMEVERESGYPHNYFDYGNGQVVYSADAEKEQIAKYVFALAAGLIIGTGAGLLLAGKKKTQEKDLLVPPAP